MLFADPVSRVEGLTIYRDYSNPLVFYYLPPESPRVARVAGAEDSGDYAFRLVVYRRDPNRPLAEGLEDGGGFLNLDVDLRLPTAKYEKALAEVQKRFGGRAELLPVPFVDGSVELVLLGRTRTEEEEAGTFVRSIQGSTKPSLYGDLRAAFSTELTRDGAALMDSVIRKRGLTMALAQYHLSYLAMSPAYNLEITIDYRRAQEVLDLKAAASVNFGSSSGNTSSTPPATGQPAGTAPSTTSSQSRTGIVGKASFHYLVESLKESRAVVVKEVSFVPGENGQVVNNQERINEIIANLMGSTWFKPTLGQPSTFANLTAATTPATTNPTATNPTTTNPTTNPTTTNPTTTTPTTTNPTTTTPTTTNPTTTPPARPPAVWTGGDPTVVTHTPAATGEDEELVVTGTGATFSIDNGAFAPVANGRIPVRVAPGQTRNVSIRLPGAAAVAESWFDLFFAFDHPVDDSEVNSYVARQAMRSRVTRPGDATGPDNRFLQASGARTGADRDGAHSAPNGPAGLDAWLAAHPGTLEIQAHASWEGTAASAANNQALSLRRWRVAQGVVGARAASLTPNAQGHTRAQAANRNDRETDRVAELRVAGTPAGAERTVTGTLRRDATPTTPTPNTTTPTPTTTSTQSSDLQVGFSVDLEMIKREERTTATYLLNTQQARQQEIHPAGQLALDFDDDELSRYLLEADLAIAFFEKVSVNASTTALWDLDGVEAVRVELRYAPLGSDWRKRAELILRKDSPTASWQAFTERADPDDPESAPILGYQYRVVVHFRPEITLGNQGSEASSVGAPGADAEGWISTYARNLVINPRDLTDIVPVRIAAGRLRFDIVQQAQVRVAYGDAASMVQLDGEHREHVLVFRPQPGAATPLETSGTLFYADGAQVALPSRTWDERLLVINEPAESILRVRVILADPNNLYKEAIVTLTYEHGERKIEQTLHLSGHAAIQEWAVRLEDPTARAWTWQAVLVANSGSIEEVPPTPGEDANLIVGFPARGVHEVDITLLAPLPMGDVLALKLELEYRDELNNVFWERDLLFRQGGEATATWFIALKDPTRTTYRYRVTLFRATGATEGPWLESESRQLVLFPG